MLEFSSCSRSPPPFLITFLSEPRFFENISLSSSKRSIRCRGFDSMTWNEGEQFVYRLILIYGVEILLQWSFFDNFSTDYACSIRALASGELFAILRIVRYELRLLAGMNLKFKRVIDAIYGSMCYTVFFHGVFIIILGCGDVNWSTRRACTVSRITEDEIAEQSNANSSTQKESTISRFR